MHGLKQYVGLFLYADIIQYILFTFLDEKECDLDNIEFALFGGKVNATNKIVDNTSTITIVSICIYRTETGQEIKRKFTRRTQQSVYVGFFTSRPVQVRERNLVRINEKLLQEDSAGILNKYSKIK